MQAGTITDHLSPSTTSPDPREEAALKIGACEDRMRELRGLIGARPKVTNETSASPYEPAVQRRLDAYRNRMARTSSSDRVPRTAEEMALAVLAAEEQLKLLEHLQALRDTRTDGTKP